MVKIPRNDALDTLLLECMIQVGIHVGKRCAYAIHHLALYLVLTTFGIIIHIQYIVNSFDLVI